MRLGKRHKNASVLLRPESSKSALMNITTLSTWFQTAKSQARTPLGLLFIMAFMMPLAFSTWSALLNNFVVERAGFDGVQIGWLQSVREIPGFLSFAVVFVLIVVREQKLALLSLMGLGAATAVTAWFPSYTGLLITTFIGSVGFHYYETVNQSLQLQWLNKDKAPQILGWLVAAGSAAALVAYLFITLAFTLGGLDYEHVYLVGGGATLLIAIWCWFAYPQYQIGAVQHKKLILRKRYWLYYALQFMSGARRQIFLVFAAFMMVEKYGMAVHALTFLFLLNFVANIIFAPMMGWLVARIGEKWSLTIEYIGLTLVFLAYGGLYIMDWGIWVACVLYVLDHLLFAMAFAMKTYFQKIADPADIAPTSAVAFTINHIAAVFLPALLGYLWITSPTAVFLLAAAMALVSLMLALLIPRHPKEGHETLLSHLFNKTEMTRKKAA